MTNHLKEIRDELVQSFNNGELIDYISESAIEIKKDEDGDISQIVFGLGGPYIYLDFEERSGVVCGYKSPFDEGSFSAIPFLVWENMRDYIEDTFGEAA